MLKKAVTMLIFSIALSGTAFAASSLYPCNIEYVDKNGILEIHKIYELNSDDDPSMIPNEDFQQYGYQYSLRDIIRTEMPEMETKELTEPITIDSQSNQMEAILPLIPPTKDIVTEDGFTGTLALDVSSIEIQSKGTATSSYTVTATRTYPNLAGADLQYIPKITTENGNTLQFSSVEWIAGNTANVDGYAITDSYTAIATYSGTATRSYNKGYTVSAEYKGTVSKTNLDKICYTAIFSRNKIQNVPAPSKNDNTLIFASVFPVLGVIGITSAVICLLIKKRKGVKNNENMEEIEKDTDVDNNDVSDNDDDIYPDLRP